MNTSYPQAVIFVILSNPQPEHPRPSTCSYTYSFGQMPGSCIRHILILSIRRPSWHRSCMAFFFLLCPLPATLSPSCHSVSFVQLYHLRHSDIPATVWPSSNSDIPATVTIPPQCDIPATVWEEYHSDIFAPFLFFFVFHLCGQGASYSSAIETVSLDFFWAIENVSIILRNYKSLLSRFQRRFKYA